MTTITRYVAKSVSHRRLFARVTENEPKIRNAMDLQEVLSNRAANHEPNDPLLSFDCADSEEDLRAQFMRMVAQARASAEH